MPSDRTFAVVLTWVVFFAGWFAGMAMGGELSFVGVLGTLFVAVVVIWLVSVGPISLLSSKREKDGPLPGKVPPHESLYYGVQVWFPLGGEWVKGQIVCPVDPERTRYTVAEGWENMLYVPRHEVEHADLRDGSAPLTEPAPVMTVPEMKAQVRAERAAAEAAEWVAGEPERAAEVVRRAIETHGRLARGEKVWRED